MNEQQEENQELEEEPMHAESESENPVPVSSGEEEVVEEEEEDECRVCRGPSEEGRPLFTPCKCSGSMGMTHQDCLTSWLEVTRGDGRCEICKTKFRFDPQYAEHAPERLPAHEVILGLSSRFLAKWLPLAIRICIAASLWLIVAPLLTNCLYHGWMIRPSSILTRWKRELIMSDVVSGAVMAAIIIISFLSLMSFADFLRVHWQQPPRQQQQQRDGDQQQRQLIDGADANATNDDQIPEFCIDDGILKFMERYQLEECKDVQGEHQQRQEEDQRHVVVQESEDDIGANPVGGDTYLSSQIDHLRHQAERLRDLALEREARLQNEPVEREWVPLNDDAGAVGRNAMIPPENTPMLHLGGVEIHDRPDVVDEDSDFNDAYAADGDVDIDGLVDEIEDGWMEEDDDGDDEDDEDDDDDMIRREQPPRVEDDQNIGGRAFDPMDPVLQDDQVDMEINVALDELLGLRGPLGTLIRNLLWLLAFNATYLGIFGFIPKTVGSVVYSGVFNTTFCGKVLKSMPYVYSEDQNQTTVLSILSTLEEESVSRNTTFKLSDFATVTLGYLSIASMIVMARYGLIVFQKMGQNFGRNPSRRTPNNRPEAHRLHRRIHVARRDRAGEIDNDIDDHDAVGGAGIGTSIVVALDATVAIVKVGVLLFLKMFLLPLFLGLWLDASTVHLFGHDVSRRLAFAGSDLFSFILLHWVAGITFMLLVTVFLLQLREVTHPDILARLIRPQEPQPDLLGNLMHETVLTHMKRMLLSLAIYAPLLTLHVTLPVKFFMASGLEKSFTFFHLNFYHLVMPQLQIPLELITFHLSMLALLERYKNTIGGLQHRWMKFMCRKMGITEYMLPREIEGFEFIGSKAVFLPHDDSTSLKVDPFFSELAQKEDNFDQFVSSNIHKVISGDPVPTSPTILPGEKRESGERVLSIGVSHISFSSAEQEMDTSRILLPTKIGRYRLRLESNPSDSSEPRIDFFREIQGEVIPRPPEGWDDLGAGGAYVQGRWAWAKERKSKTEEGVAQRTPFRASPKQGRPIGLMVKVIALMMLSWVAITVTALAVFSVPLAVGRSFYFLLRIPKKYIHDPLAFCIGAGLFFPTVSILTRGMDLADETLVRRTRRWISRFRCPPMRKFLVAQEAFVLWVLVAPAALGLSYEFAVAKSPQWFAGDESSFDWKSLAFSWVMGSVVLNTWSFLLYFNFFTRQFWANIGNGILEPPLDENGNANPHARNVNPNDADEGNAGIAAGNQLQWQGKQGRVARFFKIWRSVLVDWEWDSIDRTILITEFARPVTKQITSALVGSFLSFQLVMYLFVSLVKPQQGGVAIPFLGLVGHGIFRRVVFQHCIALHLVVQLVSGFRSSIDGWFEAAHEAARDDRYLIGEVLMNFDPGADANGSGQL